MNTARPTTLPKGSALWARYRDGDFMDCYGAASRLPPRQAANIAFHLPWWGAILLSLRNLIVAPFGLKTTAGAGDAIGLFPVVSETDDELILGFDDRHLDFRIALRNEAGQVFGATWVRCHNRFGRFYLRCVMPVHVLLSRNAIARVANAPQDGAITDPQRHR